MTMNEIERILKVDREEPYKIIVFVRSYGGTQEYEFDDAERALVVSTMLYRLGCNIEWIKVEEAEQEDEKMLNIDKYREQILKLINDNGFSGATAICTVAETNQYMKALEWVVSEYNPCLKDGDGLTPGEHIEVRDYEDEDWLLVEFIAHYDGLFICRRVNANKYDVTAWDMARKPEKEA